jgi:hypothetical protein
MFMFTQGILIEYVYNFLYFIMNFKIITIYQKGDKTHYVTIIKVVFEKGEKFEGKVIKNSILSAYRC